MKQLPEKIQPIDEEQHYSALEEIKENRATINKPIDYLKSKEEVKKECEHEWEAGTTMFTCKKCGAIEPPSNQKKKECEHVWIKEGRLIGCWKCRALKLQQPKKWKPERNYYYISSKGAIGVKEFQDSNRDKARAEFGNMFKTKQEAENMRDKIKSLLNND